MSGLRSGLLAERAGVSVQTLRFYERRGLLARPERTLGGHRVYTEADLATVRAVKAAQRLGFTLDEIARLLRSGDGIRNDEAFRAQAELKLGEVDARIEDLRLVAEALRSAIAAECADVENCAAPVGAGRGRVGAGPDRR